MLIYFKTSFEIVFPILFFMLLGAMIKKIGVIKEADFHKINTLVFKVVLPIKLFLEIYKSNFSAAFQLNVVLYAVAGVLISFALAWLVVAATQKDPQDITVMSQGISRSNYVLFGMAIASMMYVNTDLGIISVLAAIIVPIYNVLAVFVYEYYKNGGKVQVSTLFRGILKNNLILGSVMGLIFMIIGIQVPDLIMKPLSDVGAMATPLAVMCVGAALTFDALKKYAKQLCIVTIGRLVICPFFMVFGAVLLGIRGIGLAGILLLSATPAASSSYPMAKEMGGNAQLAGLIVAVGNIGALLTMFLWIAFLNRFGLL